MQDILDIGEESKIVGEIYVITNRENGKKYIGQTRSHRKNNKKYRRFGYIGRFKDHVSEAMRNTKRSQCTYLNNAIRSNVEAFYCELIENCDVDLLDDRERYYIKFYNTLYPNGYNLTEGGKAICSIKEQNNTPLNTPSKRGRPFGYKHSEETIEKIILGVESAREHMRSIASTPENKNRVSSNIKRYYDDYKIRKLSSYDLKEDLESYIKAIYNDSGNLIDYKIYINRETRFRVKSGKDSLEDKFTRLKDILIQAKELRGKNG